MDATQNKIFREMFDNLYEFIKEKNWMGACHATSAVLYTLALRLGLNAYPCIGEVAEDAGVFDHSWVDIDNEIYDIAIAMPLKPSWALGPIYESLDITTNDKPRLRYGVSFQGLGPQADMISQFPIYDYVSNSPEIDLIQLIIDIGKKSNVKITKVWIQRTLKDASWYLCTEE